MQPCVNQKIFFLVSIFDFVYVMEIGMIDIQYEIEIGDSISKLEYIFLNENENMSWKSRKMCHYSFIKLH